MSDSSLLKVLNSFVAPPNWVISTETMSNSFNGFPEDMFFDELLTRLPSKLLGQFLCVESSWHEYIRSTWFQKLWHNRRKDSDCQELLSLRAMLGT